MNFGKKPSWSPATPFLPESNQTDKNMRHKTFLPSYVGEEPQMCLIMSWHYGRQWLEERQVHENNIKRKTYQAKKFIPPNINKWLDQRKPNMTRRQRASLVTVHSS
ncbi:hypothetical protein KR054_009548 [Drosophila jambulina]|nr:hypothetical protein KR054_009548 [Drosophila jambulina]